MRAFTALLRVSFQSLLLTSMNIGGRKKTKAASGAGALVFLGALMVYLSGTYSFMLADGLGPIGGLDIMLMVILVMALFFPLTLTIFAAQSLVYSTKDIDLVMSLPVSTFSVMLARIMALYLEILIMVELLLVPAGVAWYTHGGANPVLTIVLLLVAGIFIAFIPTFIALVFGAIISLLVAKLRLKNLFTIIFSLALMVGIFALAFGFSNTFANPEALIASIDGIRDSLVGFLPPLQWVVQAVTGPNIPLLIGIAAACLLPFLLVTWLFSLFYKKLLTLLSSHKLKSNYQLRGVRGGSSFGALFRKEARKFFGTPAYVLNSGVGMLMVLIACVAAAVFKAEIAAFLGEFAPILGPGFLAQYLPPILLGVIIFFCSLSYISGVSISLEGKTLWILKEAPVSTGRIFTAKAGFSFLVSAVVSVIAIPLAAYAFSLALLDAVAMLVLSLLFPLLNAMAGLFINLLFPRLDADNDTIVIKQSASAMLSMLVDVIFLALFVGLYFLVKDLGFLAFSGIAAAALVVLNVCMFALLNTKGRKLFAAL